MYGRFLPRVNRLVIQASIRESQEYDLRWQVFWLTSLGLTFPSDLADSGIVVTVVMKFTAAGQFRIYTGFPFNPVQEQEPTDGAKVG